jgi:hypothetical protein
MVGSGTHIMPLLMPKNILVVIFERPPSAISRGALELEVRFLAGHRGAVL